MITQRRGLLVSLVGLFLIVALSACSVGATKDESDQPDQSVRTSQDQGHDHEANSGSETSSDHPEKGSTEVASASQNQVPPGDGPQAVFVEKDFDAGEVEAGKDISHTFKVKNTGKADLRIDDVKPG